MTFFLQTQSGFYRLAFDWPDVRLALDAVADQLRAGLLTAAEATAIGHAVGQALLRHTMSSPSLAPAALVHGATDEQVTTFLNAALPPYAEADFADLGGDAEALDAAERREQEAAWKRRPWWKLWGRKE